MHPRRFLFVTLLLAALFALRLLVPVKRSPADPDAPRANLPPALARPAAEVTRDPAPPDVLRPQGARRYKVLIVAAPLCRDGKLEFLDSCLPAARHLKATFERVDYEVTLAQGADAHADRVLAWLNEYARPKASDLVVLVLSGHGCRRGEDDWFLTPEATMNAGGIRLAELDMRGLEGQWKLLIICDCCRNEPRAKSENVWENPVAGKPVRPVQPPPRVAAEAIDRGPGRVRGDVDRLADEGKSSTRTWLKATRAGKVAFDENSLVGFLADGLDIDKDFPRCRADPWFDPARPEAQAHRDSSLSIEAWLKYARRCYEDAHHNLIQTDMVVGTPKLSTILCRANPPGLPAAAPARLSKAAGSIDVLARWQPHPHDGLYEANSGHDGAAWHITVPAGGPRGRPWKGGHVHHDGEGFSVRGKALFVEVLASWSPLEVPPDIIQIGLDAKFVKDGRWIWLGDPEGDEEKGRKGLRLIRPNQPTWCKIELPQKTPGVLLNYFAVGDIPADCLLTIRQAVLADRQGAVPVEADAKVDLFARWVVRGDSRSDPDALTFSFEHKSERRALRVEKGTGWLGGVLGPDAWVAVNQEVEVEVENFSTRPARLRVEVKEGHNSLGEGRLEVRAGPGKQRHWFRITSVSGLANYLAVCDPTETITIHSIVLKPAPRVLAKMAPPM